MRKFLVITASLALALSLTVSATASAEEPASGSELSPGQSEVDPAITCEAGLVCVWTEVEFKGAEGLTSCSATGFHPLAGIKHSIANDCSSRAVFLRFEGKYTGICLPHNSQEAKSLFDEIRIGEPGTHC